MYIWNLAYSVTNKCNLRCAHCYSSAGNIIKGELDLHQITNRIIIPAATIGTKYITFTGGEPFMRRDFIDMIGITHSNGIGVSIATNGMLLDSTTITKLCQSHVERIQISLEGSTQELNDSIRGAGVFLKLTEQIIPQLLDSGLFVAVSFTPTERNYADIINMAELCYKMGVQSLSVRRYSDTGRAKQNALSMSVRKRKELSDTIFKLQHEYKGRLSISSGDPITILSNPNINKFCNGRYFSGCTAGITSLAVDSVGNIKPCTRASCNIGNVLTDDLRNIWYENELLIKLRNRDNLLGKCGACEFKMICGGCRVEAMNSFQNIFGEDNKCWKDLQ